LMLGFVTVNASNTPQPAFGLSGPSVAYRNQHDSRT